MSNSEPSNLRPKDKLQDDQQCLGVAIELPSIDRHHSREVVIDDNVVHANQIEEDPSFVERSFTYLGEKGEQAKDWANVIKEKLYIPGFSGALNFVSQK